MNKEKTLGVLMTFIVLILVFYTGIQTQIGIERDFNEKCNRMYEEENWSIIETTGTGKCRWFIGQCWECIGLS